jgi:hypothetical protein
VFYGKPDSRMHRVNTVVIGGPRRSAQDENRQPQSNNFANTHENTPPWRNSFIATISQ